MAASAGAGGLPVLFSYFRSSCSYRVRIALAHKGVEYTTHAVNLLKSEHKRPEFLELNPLGLVPALQIDGHCLSQSAAVLEYLEETRPAKPLLPGSPVERARVRSLCQAIYADTQPVQNLSVMNHVATLVGRDSVKKEWALHYIRRGLSAVEAAVVGSGGAFCVGDEFSMADVCLVPQVYNGLRFGVDLAAEFPRIAAVYARTLELEAVRQAHPHAQPDCPEDLRGQFV
mmetsp:Transcript_99125/g.308951  ORF Transcript_99125/g.308951 Transcript_99125/m.308951 type:complete len:229 (+) Transcript_99125:62-748(+)